MPNATAIRTQIEAALANRIPSALTPVQQTIRMVGPTGIASVDALLEGGLPLGTLTEMVGPEGSGRTSLALAFLAQLTQDGKVCAWMDVSNALKPESMAAAGVHLAHLLWVRCGVPDIDPPQPLAQNDFRLPEKYLIPSPAKKGLHGGGFGSHPRQEQKGLPDAVSGLFQEHAIIARCVEPQRWTVGKPERFEPPPLPAVKRIQKRPAADAPWAKLDQALRVTDLLLQGGGFSAIVLDMGSIAPTYATRIPLATWFRYRAAAERSQAGILLLSQHPCAKSSAGLVLHLHAADAVSAERTVFTGIEHHIAVSRQRFTQSSNVFPLKKPVQRVDGASWKTQSTWAGRR
jgi:recombination protein RecA